MRVAVWGASDVGRVRKGNEDAFLLESELGLVAVADGMGGHARGDVAAQLACNVLRETISSEEGRNIVAALRGTPTEAHREEVRALLERAVQAACTEVYQAAVAITGEGGRMGTTLDAVLVVGTSAFLAHVGDGRVFLLRGHEVHQLTVDHSLVQQQLKEGLITEEQARTARNRNVITRALGVFPSVQVDLLHFEMDVGDRLLLCSDGLHRYVGIRELGMALLREEGQAAVRSLVNRAIERGGRDNITCVVAAAEVEELDGTVAPVASHLEVLRRVDLFQYCTYRELLAASQIAERRSVPRGTLLFEEGDEGRECFIIVSGRVQVRKGNTLLANLQAGDYFGEMCFVDTPKRSADALTGEDTQFLVIDRDRFLELMKRDAAISVKLTWQLARKLAALVRATNDKLVAEAISVDNLYIEPLQD